MVLKRLPQGAMGLVRRQFLLAAATMGLLIAGMGGVSAQTAVTLTTPGLEYTGSPYTLGFEFTVDQAISVTSLGVYDSGANGLANSAQVGIWNLAGDLLVSATVPTGTGGTLVDNFRYTGITPFALTTGTTYIVGSYVDDLASSLNTGQGGVGFSDPVVNVVQDRYSNFNAAFSFPTQTDGAAGGAWLGGNFQFGPAAGSAAPEPGTLALLGVGMGVAGLIARRRAR